VEISALINSHYWPPKTTVPTKH